MHLRILCVIVSHHHTCHGHSHGTRARDESTYTMFHTRTRTHTHINTHTHTHKHTHTHTYTGRNAEITAASGTQGVCVYVLVCMYVVYVCLCCKVRDCNEPRFATKIQEPLTYFVRTDAHTDGRWTDGRTQAHTHTRTLARVHTHRSSLMDSQAIIDTAARMTHDKVA